MLKIMWMDRSPVVMTVCFEPLRRLLFFGRTVLASESGGLEIRTR